MTVHKNGLLLVLLASVLTLSLLGCQPAAQATEAVSNSIISVNYIGDGLRDAIDPYKVLEKVGEIT